MDSGNLHFSRLDKVQQLIKLLPVGTLLIIVLSSIKQLTYYAIFGINISDYLQFQEYIVLFIDDLIIYSIMLGIGVYLYLRDWIMSDGKLDNHKKKKQKESTNNDRTMKVLMWLLLLITLAFIYFFRSEARLLRSMFTILIINIGVIIYLYFFVGKRKFSYLGFILIILLANLLVDALTDAYKVLLNNQNNKYHIILEDGKESISTMSYIGKTEKFLFLFNHSKNETVVIPMDRIKEMRVPK